MTTQKNIDYKIELLEKYTGLNLKDDILTELGENNHRLTSVRKDTSEDDMTPRIKGNKLFCSYLDSMVRLFEEMKKQN